MAETRLRAQKATDVLKQDHLRVLDLFGDFEELEESQASEKLEFFEEIEKELTIHSRIEEEIFYPAIASIGEEAEAQELVKKAKEEHLIIKRLLEELSNLTPEDEEFEAKMAVLCEGVESHAKEEEREILPLFKKLDKSRQTEVSERLTQRKGDLSKEMEG